MRAVIMGGELYKPNHINVVYLPVVLGIKDMMSGYLYVQV